MQVLLEAVWSLRALMPTQEGRTFNLGGAGRNTPNLET